MEALGCGLPVLVSDIPGNKEWITEGQEGWLFPDGDETALAEGMLRAYDEREKFQKMRIAARKLAEERADWYKNFAKLLEAYEMAHKRAK
jgi:glycosyltransferase involved in cell wall biosynthesis